MVAAGRPLLYCHDHFVAVPGASRAVSGYVDCLRQARIVRLHVGKLTLPVKRAHNPPVAPFQYLENPAFELLLLVLLHLLQEIAFSLHVPPPLRDPRFEHAYGHPVSMQRSVRILVRNVNSRFRLDSQMLQRRPILRVVSVRKEEDVSLPLNANSPGKHISRRLPQLITTFLQPHDHSLRLQLADRLTQILPFFRVHLQRPRQLGLVLRLEILPPQVCQEPLPKQTLRPPVHPVVHPLFLRYWPSACEIRRPVPGNRQCDYIDLGIRQRGEKTATEQRQSALERIQRK